MSKIALITGITGQDGAYLAELLLEKGYIVHGIKRRSSLFNTDRIDHLYEDPHIENQKFVLHYGDLTDSTNLIRIIQQVQPQEIYNLGAMSHVKVSFDTPEYVANCDAVGNNSHSVSLRQYAFWVWKKPRGFIRHPPLNYMVKYRKFHNLKPLLSTLVHLME